MIVESILCGDIMENCYVVRMDNSASVVVIDPGDAWPVLDYLDINKLTVDAILLTHGHFDHIGGLKELKDRTKAKIYIHELDADKLSNNRKNLSVLTGELLPPMQADVLLKDGDAVKAAGLTFTVVFTPGHSAGGVCYLEEDEKAIFCGDTLFLGSYGRTDFPDGDGEALARSVNEKLFTLPGDYVLYPGHGGTTTMDYERSHNPIRDMGERF